jgi:WD40 repeat protein
MYDARTLQAFTSASSAGSGQHTRGITCVTVSPETGLLATGSADGSVRVWDAHNLAPVGVAESAHNGSEVRARCVPALSLSLSIYLSIYLCLFVCHEDIHSSPPGQVRSVQFSQNGHFVLSAGGDCCARLFDVRGNRRLQQVRETPFLLLCVRYDRSTRYLQLCYLATRALPSSHTHTHTHTHSNVYLLNPRRVFDSLCLSPGPVVHRCTGGGLGTVPCHG